MRFFCLEGVAGDPSSCSKLKLACKSCPSRFGINLDIKCQYTVQQSYFDMTLYEASLLALWACSQANPLIHSSVGLSQIETTKQCARKATGSSNSSGLPLTRVLQINKLISYLSPYTRCRFLLGLPPGVMSRCRPVGSSNSLMRA